MSRYLTKYVGTYRVLAEINQDTNDYPRTPEGLIDPLFDDLYIPCKGNAKIIHNKRDILMLYVQGLGGSYVVRKVAKTLLNMENDLEYTIQQLLDILVEKDVFSAYEILDGESYFYFKADKLDTLAEIVEPKTSGCNISPFSSKNLPKSKYTIPEDDLAKYKSAMNKIVGLDEMSKMRKISNLTTDFDKEIRKAKGKKFDIVAEMRAVGLKRKEFIHSLGLWDKYTLFLESNI